MKDKQQYGFVILRYVHDVLTSEFINVGVVMHLPSQGRVIAKTRNTMGRLRGVFPDLDRFAFMSAMSSVRNGFRRIAKRKSTGGFFKSHDSVLAIAKEAVPHDDSSLQWSPAGGGFTGNAQETFNRLYDQFVARYDHKSTHRRTDDEIWRPVLA